MSATTIPRVCSSKLWRHLLSSNVATMATASPTSHHSEKTAAIHTHSKEPWYRVFGLAQDPFAQQDPAFFGGGQRQANSDSLRHLIHFSSRILLVTGEPGSGKTFLLKQVLSCENSTLKVIHINSDLSVGREGLLRQIAKKSGLSVDRSTISEFIHNIKTACLRRFANGIRTLLVIDDAHKLANESLAVLAEIFDKELAEAIGVLLLAQPQIVRELQKLLAGRETNLVHQLQLKNFTLAETTAYTRFYLTNSGWDGANTFSPELQQRLHEAGWGIPGRINRIAASVLLDRDPETPTKSLRPITFFVIGVVVAFVVTFVVVQQLLRGDNSGVGLANQDLSQTIKLEIPDSSTLGNAGESLAATESPMDLLQKAPATNPGSLVANDGRQIGNTGSQEYVDPSPSAKSAGVDKTGPAEGQNKNSEGDKLASSIESGSLANSIAEQGTGKISFAVQREGTQLSGQTEAVEKTKVELVAGAQQTNKAEEVQTEQENQPERPVSQASIDIAEDSAAAKPYFRSLAWLADQPDNGWTIQILGSRNEDTVVEYIDQLATKSSYFYVKSTYKNREWYVVLHGSFNSRDEARAALNKLPVKQRSNGAWIRSLAGLKG